MRRNMIVISILLLIFTCSGCANQAADGQSGCWDTFDFSLQPGEQAAYSENVVYTEVSDFEYQVTWARSGLSIEIGLIDEDGYEYLNEEVGGSSCNVIKEIPAGTYQFVVRSSQNNAQCSSENTLVAGAAGFIHEILEGQAS